MEQKRIRNIIHESDDENGNPTCWAIQAGRKKFFWIEVNPNGLYDVIDSDAETLLKTCQSLRSAKRWVSMNLL